MTTTNSKKNVSLGKPVVDGCFYWAPAGTAIPKDAITPLDSAFAGPGYISEDGIKNSTDTDTTEVKDMGGVTVINEISSYGEKFQFTMIETNEHSMSIRYGKANVKTTDTGMTIRHTMPTADSFVAVFELLLTGGKVKRIVVPDATVSEFGDITYSAGDVLGYDVTLAANPSTAIDGASSIEYIATVKPTTTAGTGSSQPSSSTH